MAELDTIGILNPTKEEFVGKFNGESYPLAAGAEKAFPEFLAFHLAKHLSDKMLSEEVEKIRKAQKDDPYRPQVGQMMVYDNPKRRIALYDIFRSKEKVQQCIESYPFKAFIGEMAEYDDYVSKAEAPKEAPKSSTKGATEAE